jgi:hypothetical protein
VIEHLPSQYKAQNSNPSTAKKTYEKFVGVISDFTLQLTFRKLLLAKFLWKKNIQGYLKRLEKERETERERENEKTQIKAAV